MATSVFNSANTAPGPAPMRGNAVLESVLRAGTPIRSQQATRNQPPGENGLPSDAGMLARIQAALLEMSTSTTMVAT